MREIEPSHGTFLILGYVLKRFDKEDPWADIDEFDVRFQKCTEDIVDSCDIVYHKTGDRSGTMDEYHIGVLIDEIVGNHRDSAISVNFEQLDYFKKKLKPVSDLEAFKDQKMKIYVLSTCWCT